MAKTRTTLSGQIGCWFLFSTAFVLVLLLCLNWWFVKTFFNVNLVQIDERVFNAAQFMLPIIMIFIEFWIYDAARDFFRFRGNGPDQSNQN